MSGLLVAYKSVAEPATAVCLVWQPQPPGKPSWLCSLLQALLPDAVPLRPCCSSLLLLQSMLLKWSIGAILIPPFAAVSKPICKRT